MCSCCCLGFCLTDFWNNFSVCCSSKVSTWCFSSASVAKNSCRVIALYVVGTLYLVLPSLVFSGVVTFGALHCFLGYFSGIVGVDSFRCYINFILGDDLGTVVDMLLSSTLGYAHYHTVYYVDISSTGCLFCSVGSLVCMGATLAFPHDVFVCFSSVLGLRQLERISLSDLYSVFSDSTLRVTSVTESVSVSPLNISANFCNAANFLFPSVSNVAAGVGFSINFPILKTDLEIASDANMYITFWNCGENSTVSRIRSTHVLGMYNLQTMYPCIWGPMYQPSVPWISHKPRFPNFCGPQILYLAGPLE